MTFEDQSAPEAVVLADPKLLSVVLFNVLSNAATYTPDGGRILVQTRLAANCCELSVANTGCQLSPAEVARVFDRFWRADAARSKASLNCGLGLTLVRRAMEAMGGTAGARLGDEGHFILSLTFIAGDTEEAIEPVRS